MMIIGMRHILVHSYFRIDTELVCEAVKNDLPSLRMAIEAALKHLENTRQKCTGPLPASDIGPSVDRKGARNLVADSL